MSGKRLSVFDVRGGGFGEFHTAYDAVPSGAEGIGDAVAVRAIGKEHPVVDADAEAVFAGGEDAEFVFMRGDEGVVTTDFGGINEDGGFPAGAFKQEMVAHALGGWGDVEIALIPRDADVMLGWLGEVRNLDGCQERCRLCIRA